MFGCVSSEQGVYTTDELKFQARDWLPPLIEMLDWNETQFKQHMAGSPMRRLKLYVSNAIFVLYWGIWETR